MCFQCIYVHLAYFLKLPTKQIGLERDLAYIDPPRCTGVVKFSHKTRNKVRQRSGRKVETTTKNQKLCLYKIQQRFFLDFETNASLQNEIVSGMTFVNVFEPSFYSLNIARFGFCRNPACPGSQQKWGRAFGFCRPEGFLFTCYGFGFVEAVLVFSRNVSTKSEAPTPPGQFFGV